MIERAGAGLVCRAGDGKGLSEIVTRMAGMSLAERATMAANGRRLSEEEFDRNRLVGRLEGWLAELAP